VNVFDPVLATVLLVEDVPVKVAPATPDSRAPMSEYGTPFTRTPDELDPGGCAHAGLTAIRPARRKIVAKILFIVDLVLKCLDLN
jgi:hypothetical protein